MIADVHEAVRKIAKDGDQLFGRKRVGRFGADPFVLHGTGRVENRSFEPCPAHVYAQGVHIPAGWRRRRHGLTVGPNACPSSHAFLSSFARESFGGSRPPEQSGAIRDLLVYYRSQMCYRKGRNEALAERTTQVRQGMCHGRS